MVSLQSANGKHNALETRVMEIDARKTSFGDELKLEFTPGNYNGFPFRVVFNGAVMWCEDWHEASDLFYHPYANKEFSCLVA